MLSVAMTPVLSQRTSLGTVEETFATDLSNRLGKHEIQQEEGGFTESAFSMRRACMDIFDDGEILETLRRRHTCDSVPVVDRGYVPDEYEHSLQSAGFISAFLSGSDSDHDELEPHQQHGAPYIEQQHLQEGSNDKLFASTLKLKQQGSHASHLLALQHRHSCGSRLHALGGRARRTSAFNSCSTQQMMNTSQSQGFLGDIGADLSCSTGQLIWNRARRLTESGSVHSAIAPSSPRAAFPSPFGCASLGLSPLARTDPVGLFISPQESRFDRIPHCELLHALNDPPPFVSLCEDASQYVRSCAGSDDTCFSALTAYDETPRASMTSMRSSASSEPLDDEHDISVRLPSMDLVFSPNPAMPADVQCFSQAEEAEDMKQQQHPGSELPVPATFMDQCLIM